MSLDAQTQTREVGGLEIRVTPFPCRIAWNLKNHLQRMLGPGIGGLKGIFGEGSLADIIPAIGDLISHLDPDELDEFRTKMLKATTVVKDGTKTALDSPTKIDLAFGTNMLAMEQALLFAIEVNFKDFFFERFQTLAGFLAVPPVEGMASESSSTQSLPTDG